MAYNVMQGMVKMRILNSQNTSRNKSITLDTSNMKMTEIDSMCGHLLLNMSASQYMCIWYMQ